MAHHPRWMEVRSSPVVRLSARVRMPLQWSGLAVLIAGVLIAWSGAGAVGLPLTLAGVGAVLVAQLGVFLGPAATGAPLELGSPVRGRWEAVNSPSTKVPSHGTHGYGQAYAVDLVFAPDGVDRPVFGKAGSHLLPPERFPAFGQPVLAPAEGVVVRVVDRLRDHRSRSSWPAYALFVVESAPRELRGATGVVGNHVVLRLADGSHFLLAHLQRGSAEVRVGDRVRAGRQVARCGNTGNSTEPHLHCQRQDVASPFLAAGLPWTIRGTGIPLTGGALDA